MAPYGNKNALGNKGGRFRTTSPEPEECILLGEEMIEWVKLNNPSNLSAWYSIEKNITRKVWDAMIKTPEFRGYYEIAQSIIAQNYINCDSNIHPSIAQRFLRVYFPELKAEEDELLAYKAKLQKEVEEVEAPKKVQIVDYSK